MAATIRNETLVQSGSYKTNENLIQLLKHNNMYSLFASMLGHVVTQKHKVVVGACNTQLLPYTVGLSLLSVEDRFPYSPIYASFYILTLFQNTKHG